jgi:hypothetical protein
VTIDVMFLCPITFYIARIPLLHDIANPGCLEFSSGSGRGHQAPAWDSVIKHGMVQVIGLRASLLISI